MEALNKIILTVMDALLGWSLSLPRDAVLIALAVGTALLMVLIRKFTTNQNLLTRCDADKTQLKKLIREAKTPRDKEALSRLYATRNQVTQKAVGQEGKPLLISLIPVIFLTTWMWQRLAFIPPRAGEPCVLRAEFPVSSAGRLAHLAPSEGTNAEGGWLKAIEADADKNSDAASAQWKIAAQPGAYVLIVRHEGRSYEHPLTLGAGNYGDPVREHDEHLRKTEIVLQPMKLFGVVPGVPWLGMEPWMVAYLLIAIVAVPLWKRVLGVH